MRYIIIILLLNSSLWAQNSDVSITIQKAEPTTGKVGRWNYKGYTLTVAIQNNTTDTVYLANFKRQIGADGHSYKVAPRFWEAIGRVDTLHQQLRNGIPPRPIPPPMGKDFNPLLRVMNKNQFIVAPPMSSELFEVHTDISDLHFSANGTDAFVRLHYRPYDDFFDEALWEKYKTTEEQRQENEAYKQKIMTESGLSAAEAERFVWTTEKARPYMETIRDKVYMKELISPWFKAE